MTITRSETANNFMHFLTCVDESPEGMFVDAKEIRENIGEIADDILKKAEALGMGVCHCDGIFNLEIEIYGFLRKENESRFLGAEGYGRAWEMLDRDGQRDMNRRLESDRDFLAEQDFLEGMDMILESCERTGEVRL